LASIKCSINLSNIRIHLYNNVANECWDEAFPCMFNICKLKNVSNLSLQFNNWSGFKSMHDLRIFCDPEYREKHHVTRPNSRILLLNENDDGSDSDT